MLYNFENHDYYYHPVVARVYKQGLKNHHANILTKIMRGIFHGKSLARTIVDRVILIQQIYGKHHYYLTNILYNK